MTWDAATECVADVARTDALDATPLADAATFRRLVETNDVATTAVMLERAMEHATDEDREALDAAIADGGPADFPAAATEFLRWARKPAGGPWANLATARVARLLERTPGFLDGIAYDVTDDEARGDEQRELAVERARSEIEWWASEADEREFLAAAASAAGADLNEIADAAVVWAERQRAAERAAWSSDETAATAKALERRDVLKRLLFFPEEIADGELDEDALMRFLEREVDGWESRLSQAPRPDAYETAQRADLREIARTFLAWRARGAVSSWEGLRF